MIDTEQIPEHVMHVCKKIHESGFEAYLVGGCIRDCILGKNPKDWDVATSARPGDVAKIFEKTVLTGEKHGTVTVVVSGHPIEVTTYRSEGKYSDGRRPDYVVPGKSIEDDLARRDFTINSIAYCPYSDKLVDPFGGVDDLKDWPVIRAVGDPSERFSEDGLRVMRAIRLSATTSAIIDFETRKAIKACISKLNNVSSERKRDELLKTISAESRYGIACALDTMNNTGVLASVLPELVPSVGHAQNDHHRYDVWEHTIATVINTAGDEVCRLGALLHDVGKPATASVKYGTSGKYTFHDHEHVGAEMAEDICSRLKLSNEAKERVVGLVRHHMFSYEPGKTSNKAVRRLIKRVGPLLPDLIRLRIGDIRGKGFGENPEEKLGDIREHCWNTMKNIAYGEEAIKPKNLAIDGHDVMSVLGIEPGPQVGKVLDDLLEVVMEDPETNNKEDLKQLVSKYKY